MKIGYTTDELLDTEKHQEGFIFFDDLLDSNQKAIDPFFYKEATYRFRCLLFFSRLL